MKTKTCIKCGVRKEICFFYKHPQMKGGYTNECIECTKKRIKISSGNIKKECLICGKTFGTCISELNRGGGKTCSRDCYFKRLRQIVRRKENSPNWKGDRVGREGLHKWVKRNLGKPHLCEVCRTTKAKKYEWANKSGKYKRELTDWIRLCTRCHMEYDNSLGKRKKTLTRKYGWKFKNKSL